jgi:serine protease Do
LLKEVRVEMAERVLANIVIALALAISTSSAAARTLPDFTSLAEEVSPAVVNIGTTLKKTGARPGVPPGFEIPDVPEDSPLYEFFRKFFGEGGEPGGFEPSSSLGSGFIISKDGYVISNYHVVKDADEIVVRLSDRREFVAEIIGTDERSDLAVLKIEADNLPVVRLGNSAALKVGEWVLAIGSPFGFEHSVTAGIVSAMGRSLPNENYVPFIQTDVAINPGNSGGPLFNLDGEVVGVNSQIYSRTGGFMGLSFAIPVNVALTVYEQLKAHGKVTRGWLGVLIQDVTRELAESFGMKRPHGALVSKVLPDSPAATAGMQPGDIVTEYDGKPVELSADLPPLVGTTPVGDKVPLTVIRDGESKTLTITIGELPSEEEISIASAGAAGPATDDRLNITVTDLSPEQRAELDLEDHGILVTEVRDGPAQRAGIRDGDVLLLIDNQEIKDAQHFKDLVAGLPAGKSVPVLVQRRGGPLFLGMKLPEDE